MKKSIFLLSCLFIVNCLYSQDIAPSSQAQGYLENKNVTVDYTTGVFHYKVPLYTLGDDQFKLPIFLEYMAKGVKAEDKPGYIGFNWNLVAGGIITRTIRGGIADENEYYGYLWTSRRYNAPPLADDIANVNEHYRDGESDIFTVVLNGQTVHFIIQMDENCKIFAKPLECTDIRIECESADGKEIDGWVVADNQGSRYIYRQKEWTSAIYKEDAISFNGLRNKYYISSWYLNRIEPGNRAPIIFNYMEDVQKWGKQKNINDIYYTYNYSSIYNYGQSMMEYPFDFTKYRADFDKAIKQAHDYLGQFSLELQLNTLSNQYGISGEWVRNPSFNAETQAVNTNFRVMGQLADIRNIASVSNELITTLDNLINMYQNQTSHNAQMATSAFRSAKEIVIQSLTEVKNITTKEVGGGTSYYTRSPILDNITSQDKIIGFQYSGNGEYRRLTNIRLYDILKNRISEVKLDQQELLRRLTFMGKDSLEVNHIEFDYYTVPSDYKIGCDIWGYPKQMYNQQGIAYDPEVDTVCSKNNSLRNIITSDGGRITVDYESNQIINKEYMPGLERIIPYGGIRLKKMVLDDEQIADTIYYEYPLPGQLVYNDVSNIETIRYENFSDQVLHTRAKYDGNVFLNQGNNGIYYQYVKEIMPNKGTKGYLFYVPYRYPLQSFVGVPYAFWLNGLPLAVAIYDKGNNLKRIVKNTYYTDMDFIMYYHEFYSNTNYFIAGESRIKYNQTIPQVQAYGYYMNAAALSSHYRDQGNSGYCPGLYGLYLANIEPRTTVQSPLQYYNIYYGGKTLLKEQCEYQFETELTNNVTVSDFSNYTTGTPYLKTEYFYDNLQYSTSPTRIATTDSKGDLYTTVIKRITEIDDTADPVILKMKQQNILSPIVKQVRLKNNCLLDENVFTYEIEETDNKCYWGISGQYSYVPVSPDDYVLTLMDRNLFTYGISNYSIEKIYQNRKKYDLYLPVEIEIKTGVSALYPDFKQNKPILKANNVNIQSVAAVDQGKYKSWDAVTQPFLLGIETYEAFRRVYEGCLAIQQIEQSKDFQDYVNTSGHQIMMELIGCVGGRNKSDKSADVCALLDSIHMSGDSYLYEFTSWYGVFSYEYADLITEEDLSTVMTSVIIPDFLSTNLFKYFHLADYKNLFMEDERIEVTSLPASRRLKLFVLANQSGVNISYHVIHSQGSNHNAVNIQGITDYSLLMFDIDLSSYPGASTVVLDRPVYGINFVALVPTDADFEATSYNMDGTVFARFDQTGRLELNEYDSGGRLIRVRDGKGNIVQEYQYNVANNQ